MEDLRLIDLQQLKRYRDGDQYALVPLNRWNFTTMTAKGPAKRGKTPRDANWLLRDYKGEELKKWIADGGNVGVRLRPGDLVVDYDPRNVPDGMDVVFALEIDLGIKLSDFPCVRTGSGGSHWYMRMPEGVRVKNELLTYPGIEFKAHGRQVVAAGSIHPDGNSYEWVNTVRFPAPFVPESLLVLIRKPARPEVEGVAGEIDADDLKFCLDQLEPTKFRAHDLWLELMTACHSATGGRADGLAVFSEWSTGDPNFADAAEMIAYRWETFDANEPGGIRLGTLYMHVLDAGGRLPRPKLADVFKPIVRVSGERAVPHPLLTRLENGKPKSTVPNCIEALKSLELGLYYDTLANKRRLRDPYWIQRHYKTASESVDSHMLPMLQGTLLEEFGLDVNPSRIREAVDVLCFADRVNPLANWLDSLTWDKVMRLDSWLTRYAGVKPTEYTNAVGRATILGAVARAYAPGIKFDTMLVLEGPQGTFKSTIVKILGGDYYMAGLPNKEIGDKDIVAALAGKWIIEIEELSAMRRADAEAFKGFLSKQTDTTRLPYEPLAQDYPRRCIFIGTTNPSGTGYLRDTTGNRRFFPVEVGVADTALLAAERDQLFAEAVIEWRKDRRFEALLIPQPLWSVAALEQEERRAVDPMEDAVGEYIAKLDVNRVTSGEVYFAVMRRPASDASPAQWARLGSAMALHGWKSTNKVQTGDGRYARGFRRDA